MGCMMKEPLDGNDPALDKPTFVLSLDTEIAWGSVDTPRLRSCVSHFNSYRKLVRRLVDLLDKYEISATWAFVGRLLVDQSRYATRATSADSDSTTATAMPSEQSSSETIKREGDPSWWSGTDVLEMVRNARVEHEIGTHTFSHTILGDPACRRNHARSELQVCRKVHADRGLEMKSLVFPRNKIAHLDAAASVDILCYRGRERNWYRGMPNRMQQAAHFLDRLLAIEPPTYRWNELSSTQHEPVNIPASMFFMSFDGLRALIPPSRRVRQVRRGLDRAIENGEIFHLWFHPFNLGSSPRMFETLESILRMVSEEKDRGRLRVCTMEQVATEVRNGRAERERIAA